MSKERDCNNCIHHTSGSCDSWECDMQTLEDYRDMFIDEFAIRLKSRLTDAIYQKDVESMTNLINEIAEQVKAERVGKELIMANGGMKKKK